MYTILDDRSLNRLIPKAKGTLHALLAAEYAHRHGQPHPEYRGTEIKRMEITNAPGFPDDTMPDSWHRYLHKRLEKTKKPTWTNRVSPLITDRAAAITARCEIGAPDRATSGTQPCPKCKGTLTWTCDDKHFNLVDYNCPTPGCISWRDPMNSIRGMPRAGNHFPRRQL